MIIRTPTNLHHAAVFPILLAYLPGSFDLEEICRADFFSPSFLFSFVFVCSCPEINPYLTFMNKGMRGLYFGCKKGFLDEVLFGKLNSIEICLFSNLNLS